MAFIPHAVNASLVNDRLIVPENEQMIVFGGIELEEGGGLILEGRLILEP